MSIFFSRCNARACLLVHYLFLSPRPPGHTAPQPFSSTSRLALCTFSAEDGWGGERSWPMLQASWLPTDLGTKVQQPLGIKVVTTRRRFYHRWQRVLQPPVSGAASIGVRWGKSTTVHTARRGRVSDHGSATISNLCAVPIDGDKCYNQQPPVLETAMASVGDPVRIFFCWN
jgi:hypothetical protein